MAIGLLLHRMAAAHTSPGKIAEMIKVYGTPEGEELSVTMPGPKPGNGRRDGLGNVYLGLSINL